MIDCKKVEDTLYQYLDQELDEQSAADFEKHIELCRMCFNHTEFERLLRDHMKQKTSHLCPDRVKNRIKNIIEHY